MLLILQWEEFAIITQLHSVKTGQRQHAIPTDRLPNSFCTIRETEGLYAFRVMLGFAIDQGVLRANFTLPAISGRYVGPLSGGKSNPHIELIFPAAIGYHLIANTHRMLRKLLASRSRALAGSFRSPLQSPSRSVRNDVAEYLAKRTPTRLVRPSSPTLHRFRKTFATLHHRNGKPVRTVMKYLRHSDLDTTLRYLASEEDEQTMAIVNSTFKEFSLGQ